MLEVGEVVLQPRDGLQVQVVGRLVEQQVVRLSEEGTSQQDTHLLLTAQVFHHGVVQILLDAQAAQQVGRIALSVPSLHLSELLLQFRDANAIFIAEIGLRIEGVLLAHDLPKGGMSLQDGVHHRVFIEGEVILAQDGETLSGTERDTASCRI